MRSRTVREVSEIVDVYICQEIGMFHIAIDWTVRHATIMECTQVCTFKYEYSRGIFVLSHYILWNVRWCLK